MDMSNTIREYDSKLDSKNRLTLRGVSFEYYHVSELEDGRIMLEPRELTAPFQISANTLTMMDKSIDNLRKNNVSEPIDLSEFEE